MRRFGFALFRWVVLLAALAGTSFRVQAYGVSVPPPLPQPVSNNAVAQLTLHRHPTFYSLMGIGADKTYAGITRAAYSFDSQTQKWIRLPDVPGEVGRIAAVAAGVGGKVYLFGGYSVDAKGTETTWPNVDIYDPTTNAWSRGTDIPVPVDDSVLGVYQKRYIYLVSGWFKDDNVRNVQVYDTETNRWRQATPIKGTPAASAEIPSSTAMARIRTLRRALVQPNLLPRL